MNIHLSVFHLCLGSCCRLLSKNFVQMQAGEGIVHHIMRTPLVIWEEGVGIEKECEDSLIQVFCYGSLLCLHTALRKTLPGLGI